VRSTTIRAASAQVVDGAIQVPVLLAVQAPLHVYLLSHTLAAQHTDRNGCLHPDQAEERRKPGYLLQVPGGVPILQRTSASSFEDDATRRVAGEVIVLERTLARELRVRWTDRTH
jgi:hypothetical protein